MRVSTNALVKHFGKKNLTEVDAIALRAILTDPGAERHGSLTMDAVDRILGTSGVEAIRGKWVNSYWGNTVALYANSGDTYNATIVYNVITGRFSLTTMGDFVETKSKQYEID